MEDKLILPIHFADGSSKSIAVPPDATARQVIEAVLSKSPAALIPTSSLLSLNNIEPKASTTSPTRQKHDIHDWRLMVVRRFRREGPVFTVAELNDPTTVKVMGPSELVSPELSRLLSSNTPESPTKRTRRKSVSNSTDTKEAPRFKLVHPEFVLKVQFRFVYELPGDYVTSVYVTPTMTADTFVELIINEYSLRMGYLVSSEEVKSGKIGTRYSLMEVREQLNGTLDTRKITEKEVPWNLWVESQKLLASKAISDAYFMLKPEETSWIKKMNSQASKLKERVLSGTSSTYSIQSVKSPSAAQLDTNGRIEILTPTLIEKREAIKVLLQTTPEKATMELANLSQSDFDALFDKFLDEINIRNAESRRDMYNYDREKKSLLLLQQWKHNKDSDDNRDFLAISEVTSPSSSSAPGNSFFNFLQKKDSAYLEKVPQFYIEKLSNRSLPAKNLLKLLVSLRVTLSTAKMAWIRDFVDDGTGISALGGVLDRVLVSHKSSIASTRSLDIEEDLRAECVKCLRVLLNTEIGYHNVLKSQIIVNKLTLCLHANNDRVRMTVAEVLAALCVLSHEGHRMVLNGFVDFKGFYGEPKKFLYLVDSVSSGMTITSFSDSSHPMLTYDYKTTAMSLINVLVNTPDDVRERNQIRNDIISCGLSLDIRNTLRADAPAALTKQIDIFEEEMSEDVRELQANAVINLQRDPSDINILEETRLIAEIDNLKLENQLLKNQLSLSIEQRKNLEEKISFGKDAPPTIPLPAPPLKQPTEPKAARSESSNNLQSILLEKDEVIAELHGDLAMKSEEISSMSKLMENSLQQFEHDLFLWKEKYEGSDRKIKELTDELLATRREAENLNLSEKSTQDLSLWKEKYESSERKVKELTDALLATQREVKNLSLPEKSAQDLSLWKEKYESSERKVKELTDALVATQREVENLSLSEKSAQDQLLWKEKYEGSERKIKDLTDALFVARKEVEEMKILVKPVVQDESDSLRQQLNDLRIEVDQRELKLASLQKELEAKDHLLKTEAEINIKKEADSKRELDHLRARSDSRERAMSTASNSSAAPLGRAADLISKLALKEKECEKLQAEIERFHQRQRERSEMVQMMVKNFEAQMLQATKGDNAAGQPMFDSRMGAVMEELVKFKQQSADFSAQIDSYKALFPEGLESYTKKLTDIEEENSKKTLLVSEYLKKEESFLREIDGLKQKLTETESRVLKEMTERRTQDPTRADKEVNHAPETQTNSSGPVIVPSGPPPPPPPGVSESGIAIPPPPAPPGAPTPPPAPGGPPPPPGMMPSIPAHPPGMKQKPKIKPPAPMKNLFWTKLPVNTINDTVWKHIQDEQELLKSINESEITLLFGKNAGTSGKERSSSPKASRKTVQQVNSTILDTNRAQQISIVVARIKITFPEIKSAFLMLNDEALSVDQLKSLQQFTPTDEEIEMISEIVNAKATETSFEAAVESLGNAEKYFFNVMKIPRLQQRLSSWLFKRRFEADLRDTRVDLDMVVNAMKELHDSAKLKNVLKFVLAFGNFLNGGTSRGEAYGVQLDVLMKMKDLKVNPVKPDNDDEVETKNELLKFAGVTTLLHYLVKISKEKSFIDFMDDMPHLESACRVSTQALKGQVKALKTGIEQIKTEIKILSGGSIESDSFVPVMEEFLLKAETEVEEVCKMSDDLDKEGKDLLCFYGVDPTKTSLEELFNIFVTFQANVSQCKKDIEDATKKLSQPRSSSPPAVKKKPNGMGMGVTMEKGDLENAIKALKVGTSRKARRMTNSNMEEPDINDKPAPPAESSDILQKIQFQRANLEKAMQAGRKLP